MTIRVPHDLHFLDGEAVGRAWGKFFDDVAKVVNAVATQIASTVPNSRIINAGAGLKGGGDLSADVAISLYSFVGAVGSLPTAGLTRGDHAYATDARNTGEGAGAGTGSMVVWSGMLWRIPGQSGAVTS